MPQEAVGPDQQLAAESPWRSATATASSELLSGRVNHVAAEDAKGALDVVLGMFPVNSHLATVLFNSEATYSFISTKFVEKHNLPIAIMKNRLVVSSPGGEMESRHVCPKISLAIEGVEFPAHLIVLESKGIDIILGMDWLAKFDGVIGCATKTVQLTYICGTKVEFKATTES